MRHALFLLLTACGSTVSPISMNAADAGAPDSMIDPPLDAGPPPAVCPDGISFSEQSGKIVVDVGVNGSTYAFVLDTGAPYSVADTSIQNAIGASGPWDVTLGDTKITLKSLQFAAVQDLRLPGVVGIIGADVFGKTSLTIDYPRSRLWMQPMRDEAALLACEHVEAKPAEVPFVKTYYLYVDGKAEGQDGFFLVDTGASLGAMPDTAFDVLDKAKPRNALKGFYTPAAIGTFWARLGSVGSFEVGGKKVSRMLVRTVANGVLPATPSQFSGKTFFGVLPSGYMRNFMVTVDYPAKKLRLDASKTATLTDPNTFWTTGIGIDDQSTSPPITVAQVLPKSSAEQEGVQIGDRILTINGMNVDAMDAYSRPWRLVAPPPAMKIPVTLSRNNQTIAVTLETRDLLLP
jgi:hypothetical protein